EQTRLPCEHPALALHPDDVARGAPDARRREDGQIGAVPVHVGDDPVQTPGDGRESSSASTTTRPATRCSPPAKRSIAAASALRAEGRLTSRRLSSSLASPVRAMRVLLGG